jgi:1-acyl-sn-glycerol-3-phosphate acyltransferase
MAFGSATTLIRQVFYTILVRPILLVLLGFNVRGLEHLQARGPHLIAANHNSHLDALVLMSLFGFADIPKVKLVAARDYWCRTRALTWLSMNIVGIIPIDRKIERGSDPFGPVQKALDDGYTLVIFPEGSRGDPEKRQPLKNGIARIVELNPQVTVTPVFMHGLGKALPRGEGLLVPFVCEINVGEELAWQGDRRLFVASLEQSLEQLEHEIAPKPWT